MVSQPYIIKYGVFQPHERNLCLPQSCLLLAIVRSLHGEWLYTQSQIV